MMTDGKKQNTAQINVLGNIYNNILKGLSLGKTLIMAQGSARCFAKGTRVRMANGKLKNIEDIEVGDRIMSADGNGYNTVTETHRGIGMLYKIHPNKSECDYFVNGEHILSIKQIRPFYRKCNGKCVSIPFCKDKIIDISVKDYIKKSSTWKKKHSMFKGNGHDFTTRFNIAEHGIGEYYGFSLDNSPYFLDYQDFVFHNSGKSRNIMIFLCLRCMNEVKKVSVVRQSLPTIKRSILEDFKIIMQQMGQWEDRRFNKTDFVYYFPNGSIMEFFSAEDEQKLRGPSRDILYANEANEISYYAFSNLRMRTYEFCIVDYNPTFTEEHWLFPLMTDERTYYFKSTFMDNMFLPQAAREEILSYKETNPALWKIYGEGEFAIIDGLVFPKENWDIIPDEDFPTWLGEEFLGLDWGFVKDPTVCVGVIVNDTDIYVREYFREVGLKTKDIAKMLEPYKDLYKYCDIDNRLVSELEDAGIPLLTMTHKNSESIMSGIRLMNQRHIHITASSTDTIKEFRNYVYKKDRQDVYQTNLRPIDKFNHCFTGDTLVQTENGEARIDTVHIGDMVHTSEGMRRVEKVFRNGVQEVWDIVITCINGEKVQLSVTPTHKVKTNKTWKPVQEIKKGDVIYLFNSSMGKNITCIMEKDTFRAAAKECTWRYGSSIMGKFLMATIFITKMKTLGITLLKTLNYSILMCIYHCMPKSIRSKMEQWRNCADGWTTQENMPTNGTEANKGEHGTESMQERISRQCKRKNIFARTVGKPIWLSLLAVINFAAINAGRHGEEKHILMKKRESAKNAGENLLPTGSAMRNVAVAHAVKDFRIVRKHYEKTYNLMINTTHEYFANGLLVSNCIDAIRYVVYAECSGRSNDDTRGFSKEELGIFM